MEGPGGHCACPSAMVVSCRTRGAQAPLQRLQGHRVLTCSFLLLFLLHPAGLPQCWQEPHARVAPSGQDCQLLA